MKTSFIAPSAAALLLLAAASAAGAQQGEAATPAAPAAPTAETASYGIGYQIGGNMRQQQLAVDVEALVEGLRAGLGGTEPRFTEEQMQEAVGEFQQQFVAAQEARAAAEAAANLAAGQQFLEANAQREGVTVLPSGLQYEVIRAGSGERPAADDQVVVHYKGMLPDGTVFDSSYDRGEPATFPVGGVIPGFAEGLQLTEKGAQVKLYIPPDIGYGERGAGPIPPNSTLVFEVELVDVVEGAPAAAEPEPQAAPPAEPEQGEEGAEGPGEG
jgi:FKBP-type peptidyl-prolyl cis-trans isomerase FklB